MARALLQSTNICAASVYGKSHDSKQRGVAKRMFCNSSVQMRGGLRISASSLSIGGVFNAVDKFQLKVAISIAAPCGRGSRCVARAMLFERRFTDKGNEVIKLAREEAKRMGHNYIVGTEQILLGLIAQGTGIAAKVLKSMGISLEDAQVEMEKIIGRGHWFVPVEIGIPRFLEHTQEEARLLGHNYIDSEHLLLGLLREDESLAVRVLENLGADPNNIRTQVIRMVNGEKIEALGDGVSGGNTNSKIPTLKEYPGILTKLEYRGILTKLFEEAVAHIDPRLGWIRHIDCAMETSVNWPIRVFMRAQEEARRLGHNYMGTEQILLALVCEGTGIAAEVLKSMGINLKDARVEVEKIIGRGNGLVTVEVLITPQAKRVLELSLEEAHKLEHNYIGYEHLLLGLLHDGEGVAVRVLKNLGADPNNIRKHIIQMIFFEENFIQMIGESTEAA